MAKATGNGHYETKDEHGRTHRFKVAKGDVLPDGATFVAAEDTEAKPTAKAQQAKRGPSETTAKADMSESS